MLVESPYPDVPLHPVRNIHDRCFNRPDAPVEDYTVFVDGITGRTWLNSALKERMARARTTIAAPVGDGGLGISPDDGEVVGILGTNNVEFVVLAHALLALTIPFTPLSSVSTSAELEQLLRKAGVTRLFVHPSFLERALQAAHAVGVPQDCIYLLEGSSKSCRSLDDFIGATAHVPTVGVRPVTKDTVAYLLFSSGTTGLPKPVVVSHASVCFQIEQNVVVGRIAQGGAKLQKPLPWTTRLDCLPLHHTYGFHQTVLRSLMQPLTVVLLPRWDLNQALEAIPKYKITDVSVIPSFMRSLLDGANERMVDLSSLLVVRSGAAHLPPELQGRVKQALPHIQLGDGYGMTEVSSVICAHPPVSFLPSSSNHLGKSGYLGVLHPSLSGRLVRADGLPAALGEAGELQVRGGSVNVGYWRDERATGEMWVDGGWLRTGDLFRADAEGNLFFVERAKDTFKVSGAQVAPRELEDALLAHPGGFVADTAIAGVRRPGGAADERVPRAWVVLSGKGHTSGEGEVAHTLHRWVAEKLSGYKRLRGGITFVDAIPRGPTGKVLRRVLVEEFERPKSKL